MVGDRKGDRLDPAPYQPPQGEPEFDFGDSSGQLFSMYSKAAEEEDNKLVERLQRDADGILIFVSPHVDIHIYSCLKWE
jgi:hypothetical protein